MIFNDLSKKERLELYQAAHDNSGLSKIIIEKDWWVTAVLRALFSLPYSKHLSFKGGTSLSKCYHLIERFSEDIDIAVHREKPDFTKTNTRIRNDLRRAACKFVREELQFDLAKQLETNGINPSDFLVKVNITPVTTTDPEIIEVEYNSLFTEEDYIKRKVIIEVSGRSMREPLQPVSLQSMIDEQFPNEDFTEKSFEVQTVIPQRTFIEKICLLHEEFAKPQELTRTERMSRHLYDLVQIMDTPVAEKALADKELYSSIVKHRRIFIGLSEFDYDTLAPQTINIIPPEIVIDRWKEDYETMQGTMIYGNSLPFNKLIDKIKQLNERINRIVW
ncbi:MAG: nucleotidyl transferase AbiEii/AbiGii toxin family protein [Bacteroidales bacterium]|jgi:predicted nucleotidyltransferase component of viral defense system|nr:nucleotidyl transferase AbiEii/AbiGii toxin family protein [Bacteroidales bacterium]